jgi:hypothetical protein
MGKVHLVLFDACDVLFLFQSGLWRSFLEKVEVTVVTQVLKELESVDLNPDIKAGLVKVVNVTADEIEAFRDYFDAAYLGDMDLGETASLAFIHAERGTQYLLSSGDHISFQVLALLGFAEKGISLEAVLKRVGITRKLPQQFSEQFRLNCTKKGLEDRTRGRGLRSRKECN